jgi:hypothetical protein
MRLPKVKSPRQWGPGAFLTLDFFYIAILVILLIGRQAHWLWLERIQNPIGGIIPLGVPWFGALGAVTVSIYGIVTNSHRWDTRWNLWHLARPVIGAILGTVAYLIFIGVIQATGTTPSAVGSASGNDSIKLITYLVIAFVVGYREQTFRTLIAKVVDTLLSPGDSAKEPVISISPSPVRFNGVTVGRKKTMRVTVMNTGTDALIVDKATAVPPGLSIDGNGFSLADRAVQGATIRPKASVIINVKFKPKRARAYNGTLTINCNAGRFPVPLTGTGTGK